MPISARRQHILDGLNKLFPNPKCELDHNNPYELLMATILSAQCTDVRVNKVTPDLFAACPNAFEMAQAPLAKIEKLIQSTGFFRSKAKSLQSSSVDIVEKHGAKVPETMEELTKLRGVGRKTANVILGTAFGKNIGVVVDTHVGRLSRRFGFTKQKDPVKVEKDLMKIVPQEDWTKISHQMILHGRATCKARKPLCDACKLAAICPRIGV